jgi:hypothetical protein
VIHAPKVFMLTISPTVQSLTLPAEVLCAGAVIIAHEFQPVDIVGGEFIDYFPMDNGNVGFYVGDVSGKGLPAPPWQWEFFAACTKPTRRRATSYRRSTDA